MTLDPAREKFPAVPDHWNEPSEKRRPSLWAELLWMLLQALARILPLAGAIGLFSELSDQRPVHTAPLVFIVFVWIGWVHLLTILEELMDHPSGAGRADGP